MYPYIKFVIPTYSLMAFLGAFAALCFLYFRLEKYQIQFTDFLKLFGLSIASGFVGSKAIVYFDSATRTIFGFFLT